MAMPQPSVTALADGIRAGDRGALARGITLVESQREDHRAEAQALLAALLPHTGGAQRIGVTGVPGVGKSTFLDAFGMMLCTQGHRVAVLAVDPSSSLSGGSILGDKARMHRLAQAEQAFIRPSPNGLTLGGVARRTRESMLLCEAAGFDVVLVETVGVGQSETVVANMVDFFLVLMLPGAGDELQGIKKGILELADAMAINKADGDNQSRAQQAVRDVQAALHYLRPREECWTPRAVAISAKEERGLVELWDLLEEHRRVFAAGGLREARRREQRGHWMWAQIQERLQEAFRSHAAIAAALPGIEAAVADGSLPPTAAADQLLALFRATGSDAPPA